jgi:hypothetical protein
MIKWTILWLGGLFVLTFAIRRDSRFSREYMGDLRNRVVGARIIEDGGSPYFYKWATGDGLRYYDPQAFDHNLPSISTSTPFLHRLMIPLADLPEATIMRVWGILCWVLYIGMAWIALRLARGDWGRWAVFLTALLFLLTNAWELDLRSGQTYLLIPAFSMLFVGLIRKEGGAWPSAAAGLVAACLVLLRPNTAFFFLPFLPLVFWRKPAFLAPVLLVFGWVLLSGYERMLWRDYGRMVREQVKIHQGMNATVVPNDPDPRYRQWEGLDMDTVEMRMRRDPEHIYSENGNVFVIYAKVTGSAMPVWVLGAAGLTAIGLLSAWFFYRRRLLQAPADPERAAIVGFCLYMISDLFSPVYRHEYNTVQWIMPLLLAAGVLSGRQRWAYAVLLLGLMLNIMHLPFIKMANTLGEYGFLAGLLAIGFPHSVRNLPRTS